MSMKIKATTPCYKFINASPEALADWERMRKQE